MKCTCAETHTETFMGFFWHTNAQKLNRPDGSWIMRHEKRMIKKERAIWKKQEKWIIRNMKKLSFFQKNSVMTNTVDSEIDDLLNQIPHKAELADEIVAFMRIAIKRGGEKIVKELNMKKRFGIGFDISNPAATKFLEAKETFELSNSQGNIDATTKAGLKRVLVEAHDQGIPYNQTSKKIQDLAKAGVFSSARAQMIATREIGVAYEEGNAEVMTDFKSQFPSRRVEKKWQTVNDERVTEPHRQNQNDGWVDYGFTFTGTGDQHAPGSDNPRCRCFTRYNIPAPKK